MGKNSKGYGSVGQDLTGINGVRDDNRLENLELWSHSQPCGQRIEDKVKWAKTLLAQYQDSNAA